MVEVSLTPYLLPSGISSQSLTGGLNDAEINVETLIDAMVVPVTLTEGVSC